MADKDKIDLNEDVELEDLDIEEQKVQSTLPIDISQLSKEQIQELKMRLDELEGGNPLVGTSGISDSPNVTAERPGHEQAYAMRDYLATRPRVTFMIPRKEGEPYNTVETVIINQWRINILKGEFVDIPIDVADILKASYAHTMNDNQKFLISSLGKKIDDVTGLPKDPSQLR